jgi:cytoskeletal protein CcmA (bactofilin family)
LALILAMQQLLFLISRTSLNYSVFFLLMKFDNLLNTGIRKDGFYIPKEMVITGSFNADISGQIAGTVNGNIWIKAKVFILKDGIVNGDISAEELVVYGKINGDVKSCKKMIVHSGAVINGNIITDEIHIEKNAAIEGLITKSDLLTARNENSKTTEKINSLAIENTESIPDIKSVKTERQAWF